MDKIQFDELTEMMSVASTRRATVAALLGGLVAPLLSHSPNKGLEVGGRQDHSQGKPNSDGRRDRNARGGADSYADRKKRKACPPCRKRKQGKCKAKVPDGRACPGGSCRSGRCVPTPAEPTTCVGGQTACAGICVDLQTDVKNCGLCGNMCGQGESCDSAACHCGSGNACTGGQTCIGGLCCPSAETNCSGTCVALSSDPNHCGACGVACSVGAMCDHGICVPPPPPPPPPPPEPPPPDPGE